MKKRGMLDLIDRARGDGMIASLGGRPHHTPIEDILDPGREHIRAMHDDELAELMAREPGSKLGRLAASEMRSRESWRGPARWSLIIAGLAFAVSLAAFIRTF